MTIPISILEQILNGNPISAILLKRWKGIDEMKLVSPPLKLEKFKASE